MNWFILGSGGGKPYSFEAKSIKNSFRVALEEFRSLVKADNGAEHIRRKQGLLREPGLYLLLNESQESGGFELAGFWLIFGHHYLEDGSPGAPDRDPLYGEEILEALTEEVWWKNYPVYPLKNRTWNPIIVLEWPSDISYRCELAPPGLSISPSEFREEREDDLGEEFWLERVDDIAAPKGDAAQPPIYQEDHDETAFQAFMNQDWSFLPTDRSLLMVIKGALSYSRISHKGAFHMAHPEFWSPPIQSTPQPFPDWLNQVALSADMPVTDQEDHYLGQPLELPGNRVAFPISGWLTKGLSIWPLFPRDIRHAALTPRDVGSRALAQFRQAVALTAVVLSAIMLLSLAVRKATTPTFEDVPPPAELVPQPALSLCSADHEKFMEEFRCQIRAYASNPDTDQPFCHDKGSTDIARSLATDFADLQALYCGIRDRKSDLWVWGKEGKGGYNFGELAAAKACFNVLGHPWQYRSKETFLSSDGRAILLPEPDVFLGGNLSINQLANLVAELDIACDTMAERMEMQLNGSVLSTLIGSKEAGSPGERLHEGYDLRRMTAEKAMLGVRGDLKKCFEVGIQESPYRARHYRDICGGQLRDKVFPVWTKLDRSGLKNAPDDYCSTPDSALLPTRDLNSCALVSRYERARFGTQLEQDEDSKPDKLWQCHIDLAERTTAKKKIIRTTWDLTVPVPNNYNLSGAGVIQQLSLDSGLRLLANKGQESKELGPCWSVLSERLVRYEPVHPLLAELDTSAWPSTEQQLCGQICASYFRYQRTSALEWVTPLQDLDRCMMHDEPGTFTSQPKGRLDRLILPWNYDADGKWVKPNYQQICAFNLVSQSYFPESYLVGGLAGPVWSGDTTRTSKIAGDKKGLAAQAAKGLSGVYGGTRSRTTCGYVAAQCFASLMVETMGDRGNEPSEWKVTFESGIQSTAQMFPTELQQTNPWCRLVQPYINSSGSLPEGQLDYPCAKGVDDARENALSAIAQLIADYGGE